MRRSLAVAIVVLLAVAMFVLGMRSESGSESGPRSSASGGDARSDALPAADAPPTIEASARSVRFQGTISDVSTLRLVGAPSATFTGEVIDAAGTSAGTGTLTATGHELSFGGRGLRVAFDEAELQLTGAEARFVNNSPGFDFLRVRATGRMSLAASTLSFTPANAAVIKPLSGPVTLVPTEGAPGGVGIRSQDDVVWADAPPTLHLTGTGRQRTTLSWAGDGVVRLAGTGTGTGTGTEHRAVHLGVKASRLDVTAERGDAGTIRLRGRASLLQAYVDGTPVMPAQARVRVKRMPGSVPRGSRGRFTWAPENDGHTDLTILRIRPDNAEAAWVSLGLDRLPSMCGGEVCEPRGGDTTGFTRGGGINAVVIPGTGDERDISFHVPQDAALGPHQIVVVIEGNFDPIRVVVDFVVVDGRPAPTNPSG